MNKHQLYFKNLDSLRFICFLLVFLHHSFSTESQIVKSNNIYLFLKESLFINGNIGVNVFFVLSGFLITYLLIVERELNNKIDVKSFWVRRILRIWPLFYLCVCFGFFLFPIIKNAFGMHSEETANIFYYLTFLNNFDFIEKGVPDASNLGVLWSIAIEEQFYILWPLFLSIIPKKKYWILFVGLLVCSLIFRFIYTDYVYLEYHSLSCMSDMVIGGLGAWLVIYKPNFKKFIVHLKKVHIVIIYSLFVIVYFFRHPLFYEVDFLRVIERIIIGTIILSIILEQCFAEKPIFNLSKIPYFTALGRISYGLYCLQFIGILISLQLFKLLKIEDTLVVVIIYQTLISLAATIALSAISFKFFEKPFLRFKKRFTRIKVIND